METRSFLIYLLVIIHQLFLSVFSLSAQTDTLSADSPISKPRIIWTQPKAIKYFNPYEINNRRQNYQFDDQVRQIIDSNEIKFFQDPFRIEDQGSVLSKVESVIPSDSQTTFIQNLFKSNDTKDGSQPSWLIFHILLIVCVFVVIFTLYNKYVLNLARSFILFSAKSSGLREARSVFKIESLLTYIFFALSYGTFFYIINLHYYQGDPSFTFLMTCINVIACIYIFKHLLITLSSWLLPFRTEFKHYDLIISTTNKIIGIYALPFLFLIGYTSDIIQLTCTTLGFTGLIIIYIYRVLISLRISLQSIIFHKFHFFIYLCTIEIAPFIILLKLITII